MKKRLVRASSEEKWQPDGTYSEGIGMLVGVKVIDGGDAVEYSFLTSDKWDTPKEAEIEYGEREEGQEDTEPFFKTSEGVTYWLGDFIRTNLF